MFRKGNKLLGPEEMEGDFAGDELLIEVCHFLSSTCNFSEHTSVQLLEAEVERPPPRVVLDDFGMPLEVSSPNVESPLSPKPEVEEPPKPAPRPYISRRGSAASLRSQDSASAPASPVLTRLPEDKAPTRDHVGAPFRSGGLTPAPPRFVGSNSV